MHKRKCDLPPCMNSEKACQRTCPKSAKYYRLAADQGNAAGQSNLADAYEKGAGVPKNLCEAKRLRLLAAAQGETYAQKNLKEMRVPARCKNTIAAR